MDFYLLHRYAWRCHALFAADFSYFHGVNNYVPQISQMTQIFCCAMSFINFAHLLNHIFLEHSIPRKLRLTADSLYLLQRNNTNLRYHFKNIIIMRSKKSVSSVQSVGQKIIFNTIWDWNNTVNCCGLIPPTRTFLCTKLGVSFRFLIRRFCISQYQTQKNISENLVVSIFSPIFAVYSRSTSLFFVGSAETSAWQHPKESRYTYAELRTGKQNFLFCGTVGWEGITIYGKAFTCALFWLLVILAKFQS